MHKAMREYPIEQFSVEERKQVGGKDAGGSYSYSERKLTLSAHIPESAPSADITKFPSHLGVSMKDVFVHEYGHRVHYVLNRRDQELYERIKAHHAEILKRQIASDDDLSSNRKYHAVSQYSLVNHEEFFAENFHAYQHNAKKLKEHFPETHKLMQEAHRVLGIGVEGAD